MLMHLYTLHELHKLDRSGKMKVLAIKPEQTVFLSKGNGRIGRFDFLVELDDKELVGFEVLTRPSKGKLKKKLSYASEVNRFVFVLPSDSMPFYQKPKSKVFHKQAKLDFFGKEFLNPNLFVWMFDLQEKRFTEKNQFSKIFNVKSV